MKRLVYVKKAAELRRSELLMKLGNIQKAGANEVKNFSRNAKSSSWKVVEIILLMNILLAQVIMLYSVDISQKKEILSNTDQLSIRMGWNF